MSDANDIGPVPQTSQMTRAGGIVVHSKNLSAYHDVKDPSVAALYNGRLGGSRGTVIPAANSDGISLAAANKRKTIAVFSDDTGQAREVEIDPGSFTKAEMEEIVNEGRTMQAKTGEPLAVCTSQIMAKRTFERANGGQARQPIAQQARKAGIDPQKLAKEVVAAAHSVASELSTLVLPMPTSPALAPQPPPIVNSTSESAPATIAPPPTPPPVLTVSPSLPVPIETFKSALDLASLPPAKPRHRVSFNFDTPDGAGLGSLRTRYHAVCDGEKCVALVYDTRFEDGDQYVPPARPNLPFLFRDDVAEREFNALNIGLYFSLGTLEVIVLVVDPLQRNMPQPDRTEPVDGDPFGGPPGAFDMR